MAEGEVFDVASLLAHCNPWWLGRTPAAAHPAPDCLPALLRLLTDAPAPPLLVIEGERQTGKSTLLAAMAGGLLTSGLAPRQLCMAALDLGPLRWCSAEQIDAGWNSARDLGSSSAGPEYLLIDDIHLWSDAEQDALAQLALAPGRCVIAAGLDAGRICARWRKVGLRVARQRLSPGNFATYLALQAEAPKLPAAPRSLRELFDWPRSAFPALADAIALLNTQFERYLGCGGYPAAQAAEAGAAQAYLRHTVVPRMLRWDAPARQGVRRGDDLELALSYLAARAGSLLDVPDLCQRLTVERPTVRHFLELLEQVGLLHRVPPLGYGDSVQRARFLICLADPALAPALLWQDGPAEDGPLLQGQVESALYRHLHGAYGRRGARVSYAPQGRQQHSLVVESGRQILPFGLHYLASRSAPRALSGLTSFCTQHGVQRGYVATRLADDFGPLLLSERGPLALMRVPTALLCLWLAAAESRDPENG